MHLPATFNRSNPITKTPQKQIPGYSWGKTITNHKPFITSLQQCLLQRFVCMCIFKLTLYFKF